MKTISTISLFPKIFECLQYGIPSRASSRNIKLQHINLADYSERKDRRVDDRPFGGEAGMVIRPDVIDRALQSTILHPSQTRLIIPDPKGPPFKQKDAQRLSLYPHLVFVCARYEGMDARALTDWPHELFSLGDVVFSGGELPAAMMIDAILREIAGILSNPDSLKCDSFQSNRLDYVHYTRPWDWKSHTPPDILHTGHHEKIRRWRNRQALGMTWLRRPELIIGSSLSRHDIEDLMTYLTELERMDE